MMQKEEWTKIWHNSQLDIDLLQAFYTEHAFPRHSHDYYVISLVRRGLQSFTHQGTKYYTPPGGLILINPGAVHTGEAADESGFEMLCLYPTTMHMQAAATVLTGHQQTWPLFARVRIDDPWARDSLLGLHRALTQGAGTLECESRFAWTLAQLIKHYAAIPFGEQRPGKEQQAVRQARAYLEECFCQPVSLTELAAYVSLSPYYLLRVFSSEVGMPPHRYLENVRIRHAQRLIEEGKPLAEVATEVGFSSQSHFTHRFKQIIGATPGQYAHQLR